MSSPHEDSPVASSPIRRSPPTRSNCTAEVRDRLAAPFLALAVLALVAGGCGGSASEDLTQSVSEASSSGGGGGAAGAASLRLSSGTVTAGGSITGTVTLSSSARSSSGGVVVYVGFQNAVLAGPKFIRIPNGMSSGTFTLYSSPFLTASKATSISAMTTTPNPASFLTQTLTIVPSATPPTTALPQVASLTLSPPIVRSGSPVIGTVTISDPAPASGAVVQLSNSNDFFNLDADLPPVAIIPAGATSTIFTVRTHISNSATTSVQEIIVGNYFGGTFQGAYLTID